MQVRIAERARREILDASSWWHQHRDKAPQLFDEELDDEAEEPTTVRAVVEVRERHRDATELRDVDLLGIGGQRIQPLQKEAVCEAACEI